MAGVKEHRLGYQYPGGVFWINTELGLSKMVNDIKLTALMDLDTKLDDKAQLAQIWQGTLSNWCNMVHLHLQIIGVMKNIKILIINL